MAKNETSWGKVSGWYDELLSGDKDSYQKKVILPNIMRLVAPQCGDKILDIACGNGFFSRELAAAGALVLGADISPELIEIARRNAASGAESSRARFIVSSAENFQKNLEKNVPTDRNGRKNLNKFNKAVMILAIQNIENVKVVIENCFQALVPEGKLFIVINHPAFRIPKASSWAWDGAQEVQYRRIDAYMSEAREKIDMKPGAGGAKTFTVSFHRPLQYYFKIFAAAGFSVSRLEEWISNKKSAAGPRQKEEDRMRKEIPLFLFLELKK